MLHNIETSPPQYMDGKEDFVANTFSLSMTMVEARTKYLRQK